MKAIFVLKGW
ncbi:hypothetical protein K5Y09_001811 [Escherichia coli]|nr:hypothetical protein [Escherichia coli]